MENDPFGQESQLDMTAQLTDTSRGFLLEIAKWSKFLAIVGFLIVGMILLFVMFFNYFYSNLPGIEESPEAMLGLGMVRGTYGALGILCIFPNLYLLRFSNKTQNALAGYNTELLTEGMENLKSTFKFWGIFTAIFVGIYAIILLLVLFGMFFTSF